MEAVTLGAGPPARFDRVARLYRPMEYLSFGAMLERCRFSHLPALTSVRRALVIGDGDGRFTARLLATNRSVQVDAVDASPAMLRLLDMRAARQGAQSRVRTFRADARSFTPAWLDYDLVVTHFFLDCLSASETADLVLRVRSHLAPNARWLVSEFHAPEESRFRAALARLLIAALYKAFRVLTDLRIRHIPPWRDLLKQNGFVPAGGTQFLGGVLYSELWELHSATATGQRPSH